MVSKQTGQKPMSKKPHPKKANLGDVERIARKMPKGRASLALEPTREIGSAFKKAATKAINDTHTTAADREWIENAIYLYDISLQGLQSDLEGMSNIPPNLDKHLLRLALSVSAFAKFTDQPASIAKKIKREGLQSAREVKSRQDARLIEKCREFLRKKNKLVNSVAFARNIKAEMDAKVGVEVPVGTIRKRISEVLEERK